MTYGAFPVCTGTEFAKFEGGLACHCSVGLKFVLGVMGGGVEIILTLNPPQPSVCGAVWPASSQEKAVG